MCFISFVEYHDTLYHYWNPIEDEFQSVNITRLFRSEYPKEKDGEGRRETQKYKPRFDAGK